MKARFEGWYYKHQTKDHTLALIPGRAKDHAFLQVVTDQKAYNITYPLSAYQRGDTLQIGGNAFSRHAAKLDIHHPDLTLKGELHYGPLSPIRGDIMGPFRHFPMECHHGILSMDHSLSGTLTLSETPIDFTGGRGYIESDSGCSFPAGYTWVQCNDFDANCSIMAAVAKIPFYGLKFWGTICVVFFNGREYRLATYKGVKILRCEPGIIELKQGKYHLSVTVEVRPGQSLPAPTSGKMSRRIRETLSCPAHFRFTEGSHVLFEGKSERASYEYESTT